MLSLQRTNGGWSFQWQQPTWNLSAQNGGYNLTATDPRDTETFERSGNVVRIQGSRGALTITSNPNS